MSESTLDGNAIDAVAELAADGLTVEEFEIGGRKFTDRPLHRVPIDPDQPDRRTFLTLDGLVEFLRHEPAAKDALVHVVSPVFVEVFGRLHGADTHLRAVYAEATVDREMLHGFRFNNPMPLESLTIALQTCFAPHVGAVDELQKFCASVRTTNEISVADDGVSQEIQAKSGVAAVMPTSVSNPWELAPWRTFTEVTQPSSPYVLRFSKSEGAPLAGLFQTGNDDWRLEAVKEIATYLRNALGDSWVVLG